MHFEAVVHLRQDSTLVLKKNISVSLSSVHSDVLLFFGGMFVFVMSNLLNKSVKFNSCDPEKNAFLRIFLTETKKLRVSQTKQG